MFQNLSCKKLIAEPPVHEKKNLDFDVDVVIQQVDNNRTIVRNRQSFLGDSVV